MRRVLPAIISRIVSTYRQAIDRYLAEPASYATDEAAWQELLANRARDFSTCFALNKPTAKDIGFDGSREPRFFSNAVEEPGFQDDILKAEPPIKAANAADRHVSVQVSDLAAVEQACANGAGVVYLAGEVFKPKNTREIRHTERGTRMTRVGLFDHVGAKTTDGGRNELILFN